MASFNLACYLPSAVAQHLPDSLACPPSPSYFSSLFSSVTSPFSSTFSALNTLSNALVSLPFLSFLLIPTTMSYGTSLNLLLFYIIWSTLILSHPPLRVEAIATVTVCTIFYLIPSTFFFLFDTLLPSVSLPLKSQGADAFPLNRAHRRRQLWVARIVAWSIFNTLLSVLAQITLEHLLTTTSIFSNRPYQSALRITTTLPTPFAIFKDLTRGLLLRELLTYTLHRWVLHHSASPFFTLHKSWYHSIPTPFPLSGTYDHPVAHLIHNFLPTFLPAAFFRFHLITYLLYLTLIAVEETFAYSGYKTFPAGFILGGMARRTDNHVLCGGEGNYSTLGLVDWIMGTSVGSDILEDAVDEVESLDLNGKMRRGIDQGAKQMKKVRGVDERASPRPRSRRPNGSDADGAVARTRRKKKAQNREYRDDD